GSERGVAERRGDRHRGAAARSTWDAREVPGIAARSVVRVVVGDPVGQFMKMRFAEQDRSPSSEPLDDGSIEVRLPATIDQRARRGFNALDKEQILYGNGHAL